MGKGKPRHNPDKNANREGTTCRFCELIPSPNGTIYYCELGYSSRLCKGNRYKCKKAWYASLARRSDRRKNIDGTY